MLVNRFVSNFNYHHRFTSRIQIKPS